MSEDKAVELGYVIDPAFQGRGKILLYGHTHESKEDKFYQSCLRQMQENDCRHAYDACDGKIRACNVGCMLSYMNYTPRTLEEILVGVEVKE